MTRDRSRPGAVLLDDRTSFPAGLDTDELAVRDEAEHSGIVAVVEIRQALAKADRMVERAIDKQIAAEIDREAVAAKESLARR